MKTGGRTTGQQETSEFQSRLKKSWRGALAGGALCALLGWVFLTPVGDRLKQTSYDIPFGLRGPIVPTEAALIYMDEKSYQEFNQDYFKPWDRALHAELLRRLTAQHVAGVVFDIVFTNPGEDTNVDNDFAAAIKENGKVILAADYKKEEDNRYAFYKAFSLLDDAAGERRGADSFYPDEDFVTRAFRPADPTNDVVSSEAWTAAALINAPVTANPSNRFKIYNFNYYGPSRTIPNASYSAAHDEDSGLPTNFFTGKMVFIGARFETKMAGERKDEYATPFSMWDREGNARFTCGVEIQATEYLNLVRQDWLLRLPQRVELALVLLFGTLVGFGLRLLQPLQATLSALLFAVTVFGADYVMFLHWHLWFAWMIMVAAQIPLALIWSIVFNSVQLYVEKRLVEQTLGNYLSEKLVKKFANDPKLRKPGAEKQLLTILFTDIANFTTISEGMDSNELALLMNQYFQSAVANCIFPHDGTVIKYIGDAVFAIWNAPEAQPDHALRACAAALQFKEKVNFSAKGKPLITRLGLHTGEANVGNFGSDARFDYTAIGENINLASRMEGLNKYLGTRVLLTNDTKEKIDGQLVTRYVGQFRLKGFEKAVGVHELTDRSENEAATAELRKIFADGLEKFARRDFYGAEDAFQGALKLAPHDGPSEFYLEQIAEFKATLGSDLPADWHGEITLKDK